MRSLGLLHDLKDYISSVETLAADQRRELEKVKEQKRDMERYLARAEAAQQERGSPGLDFSSSEVADLPPRLRSLVEDNRSLREIVKRYKARTASLEHSLQQQQSQVLALAEANERLKGQLAECSRTPAQVEREEALKKALEAKAKQAETLEHSLGVLRSKMDTDTRLYKQGLGAAAREKDALKRQLVAASQAAEARDKELRALNLELRKLRRGAVPTRASVVAGTYQPAGEAAAGEQEQEQEAPAFMRDSDIGAAAAGLATDAVAVPPPAPAPVAAAPPPQPSQPPPPQPKSPEGEERIRLMLMIVREEVPVYVQVPAPPPAAAPPVQAAQAAAAEPEVPAQPMQLPEVEAEAAPELEPPQAEPEADQAALGDSTPFVAPSAEPQPAPMPVAEASAQQLVADPGQESLQCELSISGLTEGQDLTTSGQEAPPQEAAAAEEEGEAEVEEDGPHGEAAWSTADGSAAADGEDARDEAAGFEMHASPPAAVPYSRTAARAMAQKAGGARSGASSASPHPPPGGRRHAASIALPSGSPSGAAGSASNSPGSRGHSVHAAARGAGAAGAAAKK